MLANWFTSKVFLLINYKNMAQRRMFSPQIIDSDAFLDMPSSAQSLYFHLGMRADDDGFVGNPKKILRLIGSSEDDFKILLAKRFILIFESGVIVIKHWRINNLVRKDWYKETVYIDEKKLLTIKENGAYTELVNENTTIRSRRLGKVRLGKVNILQTDVCEEWNSDNYINSLLESKQRHIRLIGQYLKQRDTNFPSKKAAQAEIKRWTKDASILSEYTDDQINDSYSYVSSKFPAEWNMSTIAKYINNPIIKL